jgi:hypothetical protein
MSLKNLKTNLKSLRYGQDQKGGGDSGQPFVQIPINSRVADALSNLSVGPDFPIRGGSLAANAAELDRFRISKFLKSNDGKLFLISQFGLQYSNPKIETGKAGGVIENTRFYNGGKNTLAQVFDQPFGIHWDRPGVGLQLGVKYAEKVGSQNVDNDPSINRLVALYNTKIENKGVLNSRSISSTIESIRTAGGLRAFLGAARETYKQNPNAVKLGISVLDDNFLFQYDGGPGSVYGLGQTQIQRFDNTTRAAKRTDYSELANNITIKRGPSGLGTPLNVNKRVVLNSTSAFYNTYGVTDFYIGTGNKVTRNAKNAFNELLNAPNASAQEPFSPNKESFLNKEIPNSAVNNFVFAPQTFLGYAMPYQMLMEQNIRNTTDPTDFRKKLVNGNIGKGALPNSPKDYNDKSGLVNITTRVGIGDPGRINRDRTNPYYTLSTTLGENGKGANNINTVDKVNYLPLYSKPTVEAPERTKGSRDLIKFRFEAISNNDPSQTTRMHFRAFLTGLNDNHNAEWSPHKFAGRGESFFTYQGFTRQVSFNFAIAPQSKDEMIPLYQKLNYLITNLYPDYNANGYMRGSFLLLTIGDYLYRTPGFLTSLNVTVNDDTPWEIAYNPNEDNTNDKTMMELPQVINVSCQFTPVHNILPRKGALVPLIANRPGSQFYNTKQLNQFGQTLQQYT